MGSSPMETLSKLEKLAMPVLELIIEAIDAVAGSSTKRDAARKLSAIAAKRLLLG